MKLVNAGRITPLLTVCLCVAGCGGPTRQPVTKVTGTVYLDDKAHGPASLTLTPITAGERDVRSTVGGEVDASGKYTLTTYDQGDGAPPGKYTATLKEPAAESGTTDPAAMMGAMGGATAAPLEVEIPAAGTDKLDLKFTKANPGAMADPLAPPP